MSSSEEKYKPIRYPPQVTQGDGWGWRESAEKKSDPEYSHQSNNQYLHSRWETNDQPAVSSVAISSWPSQNPGFTYSHDNNKKKFGASSAQSWPGTATWVSSDNEGILGSTADENTGRTDQATSASHCKSCETWGNPQYRQRYFQHKETSGLSPVTRGHSSRHEWPSARAEGRQASSDGRGTWGRNLGRYASGNNGGSFQANLENEYDLIKHVKAPDTYHHDDFSPDYKKEYDRENNWSKTDVDKPESTFEFIPSGQPPRLHSSLENKHWSKNAGSTSEKSLESTREPEIIAEFIVTTKFQFPDAPSNGENP